ncbi:MAG: hypothetical protein HQ581_16820, partial [Planctomycetes bacterium]|nr:hypothetical protein [Planctomycetota bacterium]
MTSVPRFAHPPGRTRPFALGIALLLVATLLVSTAPAQGVLGGVRSDVRNPPPPSPPAPASPPKRDDRDDDHHHHSHSDYHDDCDDGTAELYLLGGVLAVVTVTSPLWLPRHLMQDDCGLVGLEGRFPGFPYDDVPGFMVIDSRLNVPVQWPLEFNPDTHLPTRSEFDLLKNWSGRFRLEYADTFDGVERLGGHLLIETTSRFGMDMSLDYFEETLLDG